MKRRNFVTGLGLSAGTGAALTSCGGSDGSGDAPNIQTKKKVRWTLASSYPRTLDTIYGFSESMAARVSELTDGMFQIDTYPSGDLVPGTGVFEAVEQGSVEIGHTAAYYYVGKDPAFAFETAVPFGLTARQQTAWLLKGGGLDLMNGLLADFNIMTFPGGNTGVQMGGWFRNEINSLTDLKGLKMRIPGLGGKIMSRLGVTVQILTGGEIYQALERGAIDATEWVGPYDDQKLGFWQVAKNYYYPGWWEPGATLSIYVNRPQWEKLPKSFQAALKVACAESSEGMLASYDAKNPIALQELLEKGVNLRPFPDDVMAASKQESEALHQELAAEHESYAKVYGEWKKFQDLSSMWFATAEQHYTDFTFPKA